MDIDHTVSAGARDGSERAQGVLEISFSSTGKTLA